MGVIVDCAQRSLASANCLHGDGGQIQSIRQTLVDIEEHSIVEMLLGHSRSSQVGFDALEGRKGLFPNCSGNRECEIDPHQFVYLTKHAGSQWWSGKHVYIVSQLGI